MPMSSQWPSVVSLPLERSTSRPATAGAPLIGGQPSSGSTLPSPSASRLGRSSPPTAFATLPSVSEPSSPNSAASGNSPAPTASNTMTHARGMELFYEGRDHGPRTPRRRRLHRPHHLARRRRDLDRRPHHAHVGRHGRDQGTNSVVLTWLSSGPRGGDRRAGCTRRRALPRPPGRSRGRRGR